MPFELLQFSPGYYTEATAIDASTRYIDGDHVRFWKGFPRKIGGSVKFGIDQFLGYCRGLTPWVDLKGNDYLAVATNIKLYISQGGTLFDITPIVESGTYGINPLTTTLDSNVVNINQNSHNQEVGNYIILSNASTFNGVTLNGEYAVNTIVDTNNFTVIANQIATGSGTGGGSIIEYQYELPIGAQSTSPLGGWGSGTWGEGTWGTPRANSGFIDYALTWSGSNYGEDLVYSPRDGGIYIWLASTGLNTRATLISQAPVTNKFVLVSPQNRYVIAMGAFDGTENNPLFVAWCSQNDYTDWTPTIQNTAGDTQLSSGNLIMTACLVNNAILISTDTTIYQMYPDSEFVFGFQVMGNGACISPNGMVEFNGIAYWMGANQFYVYNGAINILPCDVQSFIFDNIDTLQFYKVYAFVNSEWNEIWWYYQDIHSTTTDCNRYVVYNYVDNIWHYGSRNMSAGYDRSVVTTAPVSASTNGYVYEIESGTDEDGAPLSTYLKSGAPQVLAGNRFSYIRKFIPNMISQTGNIDLTISTRYYPQDQDPQNSPTYVLTPTTEYFGVRQRGDEFYLTYTNAQIGSDFWMGNPEVQIIPTGSRF